MRSLRSSFPGFLLAFVAGLVPSEFLSAGVTYDPNGNLTQISSRSTGSTFALISPSDWLGPSGGTATFAVSVSASGPITYQWRKGSQNIDGATGATLHIPNVTALDVAQYSVSVRAQGRTIVSRSASLSLDDDQDGLADDVENRLFFDLDETGNSDYDDDGVTNAEELADKTDPTRATSRYFRLVTSGIHGRVKVTPASATGRYRARSRVQLSPEADAGNQFVEWTGTYQSLSPVLNLTMNQDVTQTAVFGTPLGIALDAPQFSWQIGGTGSWTGQRQTTHDTRSAGESPKLTTANQSSYLSTYVEGPATVSFWWFQPASSTAALTLQVDGVLSTTATKGAWAQQTVSLTPGVHLLQWTLSQGAGSPTNAQAWLDEVRVSTQSAISLPQALDAPSLSFATDRLNPWFGSVTDAQDGIDCAKGTVTGQYRTSWIETRLPGPGTLSFWWKYEGSETDIRVRLDGNSWTTGDGAWEQQNIQISSSGPHTVRWEVETDSYAASAVYGTGYLDRITWTPSGARTPTVVPPSFTPTTALDSTNLAWATGGSQPWTSTSEDTYDSVDAMMSGVIKHRQESWIETRLLGPGNLTFRWGVSSATGDQLTLLLDGAVQRWIEGSVFFNSATLAIPVGLHTVRWRYAKDASGSSGDDRAYLDSVSFTATSAPAPAASPSLSGAPNSTLANAVDQTSLLFAAGGNLPFATTSATTHDGVDAAANGDIGDGQESWMETLVRGSGTLSFWWKVSSEQGYDFLRIVIDGTEMERISGEVGWTKKSYPISAGGIHTIRWRYTKDGSSDGDSSDTGWVDQVTWTGESGGTGGGTYFAMEPWSLRLPPTGGTFPIRIVGTGAWTVTGLPSWLAITPPSGTGNATLQAVAGALDSTRGREAEVAIAGNKLLVIQEAIQKPVIGSTVKSAALMMGDAFSATFVSYNSPTEFDVAGLAPGLTFNPATGAISGNVSAAGRFLMVVTASNGAGRSAPVSIEITAALPVLSPGVYTGLIPPNATLNNNLGGMANLTLGRTGVVTGTLRMGASVLPIRGSVSTTTGSGARLQVSIPREGLSPLALDLTFDPGRLMGSASGSLQVSGSASSAVQLLLWKNLWSARSNPAKLYQGLFNNLIRLPSSAIGTASIPQGAGFVALTVSAGGTVTSLGKLADGTKLTASSLLFPSGEIPYYLSLENHTGTIQGLVAIDGERNTLAKLDWMRLNQNNPEVRLYGSGFGPVSLTLDGQAYVPPARGAIVLGLPEQGQNASIAFSRGGVESAARFSSLDQVFTLSTRHLATFDAVNNPASVAISVNATKGTFTGSFVLRDPDTESGQLRSIPFEGMIVPRLKTGAGFFLLNGLTPDPESSAILSGRVDFGAAP